MNLELVTEEHEPSGDSLVLDMPLILQRPQVVKRALEIGSCQELQLCVVLLLHVQKIANYSPCFRLGFSS
jgi:hypothetical protein